MGKRYLRSAGWCGAGHSRDHPPRPPPSSPQTPACHFVPGDPGAGWRRRPLLCSSRTSGPFCVISAFLGGCTQAYQGFMSSFAGPRDRRNLLHSLPVVCLVPGGGAAKLPRTCRPAGRMQGPQPRSRFSSNRALPDGDPVSLSPQGFGTLSGPVC